MPPNIFVSYSHADAQLVAPIVALLRASRVLVFRDGDTIRPGKKWRNEIRDAISDANVVVVFWCHHANTSQEVEKEFRAAIAQGKDLLLLLLDETPLPSDLAEFQYIDFREALGKGHGDEHAPSIGMSSPPPASKSRRFLPAGLAIATAMAVGFISITMYTWPTGAPPGVLGGDGPFGFSLFVLVGGLLFLALLLRGLFARDDRVQYERAPQSAHTYPSPQQVVIAKTVEAELIRRTGASQT